MIQSQKKVSKSESIYNKLGANERALLDKVKIKFLKNISIRLFGVKLRLQWSGWLQYLLPLPFLILILLIGAITFLLGGILAAQIIFGFASLLALRMIFDIVTVKLRIRPPEPYPKRHDDKDVFELMRLRYSCRSFQSRKLRKTDFDELMGAVRKYTAEPALSKKTSKKTIRLEYIAAPIKVWPPVNVQEFLVALAPKEYDRLAVMDVGRILQKVVIHATRMGLATCWIGPGADHESITSHLGDRFDPENDNIICVCAIGYKSWFTPVFIQLFNRRMHSRLPLDSLFFSDVEMKHPLELDSSPYNTFGKTFEACQWAPSSYNGQTTRGIASQEKNGKLSRLDFYAVTASRYYAAVATGIWCANWETGCQALKLTGKFKVLPVLADKQKKDQPPRYDISWVLDKPI